MFVEYARNAARMAALMKARQIMVYTDSIGLGENGDTRAVEQLASLQRQTSAHSVPAIRLRKAAVVEAGH